MKKSNTQMLADMYSDIGNSQILVAIYKSEAVVYAQVSEDTARRLSEKFTVLRHLSLIEQGARSADGLTQCWTFREWKSNKGMPWLETAMIVLSAVLLNDPAVSELLDHRTVMYRDNRHLDANTISLLVATLRNLKTGA